MTRPPLPRFIADITITVDVGAPDAAQALDRALRVAGFLEQKIDASTVARLPGQPRFRALHVGEPHVRSAS